MECTKLSQVTISDQVAGIGEQAFYQCGALENLTIAGKQLKIGSNAFAYCTKLSQVIISNQVVSIGVAAFANCTQLTTLIFEENSSLKTIGQSAFSGCLKLSGDIVIPDGVTSIGSTAFYRGEGGQNGEWRVTIPTSVTSIGEKAFATKQSFTNLKLYYKGNKIQWANNVTLGADWNVINSDNIYWKTPGVSVIFQGPAGEYGSGTCGDNVSWTLYDTPSLVISGTGAMKDYSGSDKAPWNARIENLKRTLTDTTLKNELNEISVVIEKGVTSIGDYAFCDAAYVKEVTIPEGVTSIGSMAFKGCGKLEELTLPASVTTIKAGAFQDCEKLTTASIPAGVVSLDLSAYDGCTKLAEFEVAAGNTAFKAMDGILFNKAGTELLRYPACKDEWTYTIPDGVTTIAGGAFKDLTGWNYKITIPKSVTTICDGAFQDSHLHIFYLGTEAEWGAVNYHEDENQIYGDVHCSAGTIDLGSGNELTWVMDGDGKLTISGAGAIPDYGDYGDTAPWYSYNEDITKVVIGDGITAIGNYAFSGCSNLEEITIPGSVTVIGDYAFCGCGLEKITLPTGLTAIGDYMFYNCRNLTEITIPAKVETIGEYAFSGDEFYYYSINLERVIFAEGSQLETIGNYAFYGCSCLTEIEIPATVTEIGEYAFGGDEEYDYDSSGLESLTFAAGSRLKSIGENAFKGAKITSVTIPAGVTEVKGFEGCKGLASVTFAAGSQATSIGEDAFAYCSDLKAFTIPAGVTSIGNSAFSGSGLETVEIPAGVTSIDENAFRGSELTSVVIKSGVPYIGEAMFSGCTSLTSIVIPKTVKEIKRSAFGECGTFDVYYEGTEGEWQGITIDESEDYWDGDNTPLLTAAMHYNYESTSPAISGFSLMMNGSGPVLYAMLPDTDAEESDEGKVEEPSEKKDEDTKGGDSSGDTLMPGKDSDESVSDSDGEPE